MPFQAVPAEQIYILWRRPEPPHSAVQTAFTTHAVTVLTRQTTT